MKLAVITVGYNRPDSMAKLLDSVISAEYSDEVDLIVSIDKGKRQSEIIEVADKTEWKYGKKIVRAFPEKQGLRNHILQCGDYTEEYDAVIVLEDDLVVSKWYYSYVKNVLEFYCDDDRIAGISLYKHETNPGACRPFIADNNGYDTFLMQYAMSWGQCWTKKMWKEFRTWYKDNEGSDLSRGDILPRYISAWNTQSWLKYYMRYIVEKNMFFVYPYISLSTNASDVGEHCRIPCNDYQVPLLNGNKKYQFPSFDSSVKYDVFFERIDLDPFPDLKGKVMLDFFGCRSSFKGADYVISTQELPFVKLRSFQLKHRPVEINALDPVDGNGAYLYDLKQKDASGKNNSDYITRYDVRAISWRKLLHLGWSGFTDAVINKIKRKK